MDWFWLGRLCYLGSHALGKRAFIFSLSRLVNFNLCAVKMCFDTDKMV